MLTPATNVKDVGGGPPAVGPSALHPQQKAAPTDSVAQQQQQKQQPEVIQPRPISTLSVRQLFIKRRSPAGLRAHMRVTPQRQPSAAGQHSADRAHSSERSQHQQNGPQCLPAAPQPSSTLGSAFKRPNTIEQAHKGRVGEQQSRHGPTVGSHSRPPLAENQQGDPSTAPGPPQKPTQPRAPHFPHTGYAQFVLAQPVNPALPSAGFPGEPGTAGQPCGQQGSGRPLAAAAGVRLPQSFPPPLDAPTGSHVSGSASCLQVSGRHSSAQPSKTGAAEKPSGVHSGGAVWPQSPKNMQQQHPQQQHQKCVDRPSNAPGHGTDHMQWPIEVQPAEGQELGGVWPQPPRIAQQPQQLQWPGQGQPTADKPERVRAQDVHRKQQARVGNWIARVDAAMEDDFVVVLPKQAAAAAAKSASAPAAGRPAATAPDLARSAGSAPAGSAAQLPPQCAPSPTAPLLSPICFSQCNPQHGPVEGFACLLGCNNLLGL